MTDSGERKPGIARSIQTILHAFMEGLGYRLQLFAIEFGEERERAFRLLLGVVLVAFCAFTGFLCLNSLLIVVFWEDRIIVLSCLTAGYLLIALIAGWRLWHSIKTAPKPFAATISELDKDRALGRSRK